MLAVENITKRFGEQTVLSGVSFVFPEGAVTALRGASGCGKTTLVHIILGLLEPDAGRVVGREGTRMAAVFQEDRLIESFNAARNVRLTTPREVSDARIAEALRAVGIDPRDDKRVSQFSGGMRRRVAIVRAALFGANVVLLDEPFKGLDEGARQAAIDLLRATCPGATMILVSHDREDVARMGASAQLWLRQEGEET